MDYLKILLCSSILCGCMFSAALARCFHNYRGCIVLCQVDTGPSVHSNSRNNYGNCNNFTLRFVYMTIAPKSYDIFYEDSHYFRQYSISESDIKKIETYRCHWPNVTKTLINRYINVEYIDLSQNGIVFIDELMFSGLNYLRYLNLSGNSITSLKETSFLNGASSLITLDLSSNYITTIANNSFSKFINLQFLHLQNNSIHTISDGCFNNLHALELLNLNKNNITMEITSETFKDLFNIRDLNITYQHIQAIRNNAFYKLTKLKYLNVSHNSISNIENSSFVNMTSLEILDISYNKVENLFFLKMFASSLTEINVNHNKILIIPETVFEKHKNLQILDLSNNVITTINQNALPINNLKFFKINSNQLSGTVLENVLSPAQFLKDLNLSGMRLDKLDKSAIINMTLIESIDLSHNNLSFIHPSNFKGLENITFLDISYNNLKYIDLETPLPELKVFYIRNNELEKSPDIFGINSKLIRLDISYNNIQDVIIQNITQIEKLDIAYNKIKDFNNEYTEKFFSLRELKLASNELEHMVNVSYFKNLTMLDVSNNKISTINMSNFGNGSLLNTLILSGNRISVIDPGTFQNLAALIELDLSSNSIQIITHGSLTGLSRIEEIKLSYNRLQVLDPECFHLCINLKKLVIDYNHISLIDIEKFASIVSSLDTLSLGANPVPCNNLYFWKHGKIQKRTFNITSIERNYKKTNIDGIQCGIENTAHCNTGLNIKPIQDEVLGDKRSETSSGNVALAWCGVIGGLAVSAFLMTRCFKSYFKRIQPNRERVEFHLNRDINRSYEDRDLMS